MSAWLVISAQEASAVHPSKLFDVELLGQQLRQAVLRRHCERLVEVVVSEDRVGAEFVGGQYRFAPGSVVGCTAGPKLDADADRVGHVVLLS